MFISILSDTLAAIPAEVDVDVYSENLLVAIEDGGEEVEMAGEDDGWLVEMSTKMEEDGWMDGDNDENDEWLAAMMDEMDDV